VHSLSLRQALRRVAARPFTASLAVLRGHPELRSIHLHQAFAPRPREERGRPMLPPTP
jgi:hypothetical protein